MAGGERQRRDARAEPTPGSDDRRSARNESQRVLAGVMLDKGIALAEQGEIGEGLFWMLEGAQGRPGKRAGPARRGHLCPPGGSGTGAPSTRRLRRRAVPLVPGDPD